jgi:hypothetical protein
MQIDYERNFIMKIIWMRVAEADFYNFWVSRAAVLRPASGEVND